MSQKKNLFVDDPAEKREEMLKGMADKTEMQSVRAIILKTKPTK